MTHRPIHDGPRQTIASRAQHPQVTAVAAFDGSALAPVHDHGHALGTAGPTTMPGGGVVVVVGEPA